MNPSVKINPEFKALIPPLSTEERQQLEANILADGCRDPLVVWNGVLLDGHNRYEICTQHGLPFDAGNIELDSREAAINWIINNQLGRRNLHPDQASYLRGKRYNMEKKAQHDGGKGTPKTTGCQNGNQLKTGDKLADEYKVSARTIYRDGQYAAAVDTLQSAGIEPQQVIAKENKSAVIEYAKAIQPEPEPEPPPPAPLLPPEPEPPKPSDPLAKVVADVTEQIGSKEITIAAANKIINKAKREIKRNKIEAISKEVDEAISTDTAETQTTKEPARVEVSGHILLFGDNSDPEIKSQIPSKVALAFCDPPYNSTNQEWDGDHVWTQDWLADQADIVAVTPGISAINEFMRNTEMPYRWSTATHISNGMTRGALGFGNWIYTALFSNQTSIHKKAQDHSTVSIKSSDKFEDHSIGAQRQKPPGYLAWLFDLLTDEGDTILDPFAGSGTSVLAAHRLGRRCIAIEKDEETYQAMVRRVRQFLANDTDCEEKA